MDQCRGGTSRSRASGVSPRVAALAQADHAGGQIVFAELGGGSRTSQELGVATRMPLKALYADPNRPCEDDATEPDAAARIIDPLNIRPKPCDLERLQWLLIAIDYCFD